MIHLQQIVEAGEEAQGGFAALEGHSDDAWGGYIAIRRYLHEHALDETSFYGFVPASFGQQTGLTYSDVTQYINTHSQADALAVCPFVYDTHVFLNLFEQGEYVFPGLMDLAQDFLREIGLEFNLVSWVAEARTSVRVQYVIARPVFWRTWLGLADQVFAMAASADAHLSAQLNAVPPGGKHSMKWYLVERLAALVLDLDKTLQVVAFDPIEMPATTVKMAWEKTVLRDLDLYKKIWNQTLDPSVLAKFEGERKKIFKRYNKFVQSEEGWDDPGLFYACISHIPLPVPMPDKVTTFYMGGLSHEGAYNTATYAPEWVAYNQLVAGMEGLFAVRNYILQHRPDVTRIGICSYRKFVSRYRITGVLAEDGWTMDVIRDADRERQSLEDMMDPGDAYFLVGNPIGFMRNARPVGYLEHYIGEHHAQDLLRMVAVAQDLGVFNKEDVYAFLHEKPFYIGGVELGVFPAEFWLQAVGQAEDVLRECIRQYPQQREGYQRRAWAFCAERLTSYMIARYLRGAGTLDVSACYGKLNIMVQGDDVKYIVGGLDVAKENHQIIAA